MEAMEKLREGQKFNEVASTYSEDKARQGVRGFIFNNFMNLYMSRVTWAGCQGVQWWDLSKRQHSNYSPAQWINLPTQIHQSKHSLVTTS